MAGYHLGGGIIGSPTVAETEDGRLDVFVLGGSNNIYENFQTTPGGTWSGFNNLGGNMAAPPTVEVNNDGTLEIFAQGSDGSLWHNRQNSPGQEQWTGWNSLGGGVSGPPAVLEDGATMLNAFVIGGQNVPYVINQSNNWSSSFSSLGGALVQRPAVALNYDGRQEIFGLAFDSSIQHQWQNSPGGSWLGWQPLTAASNGGITNGSDLALYLNANQAQAQWSTANANCKEYQAPPWIGTGWPCGAMINFTFHGFRKKAIPLLTNSLANWNQQLVSYYSQKYADYVPVTLQVNAGGPQTATVASVCDTCLPVKNNTTGTVSYSRGLTTFQTYDSKGNFLVILTQLIEGMEGQTLTMVLTHEIGHSFGLFDCNQCNNGTSPANGGFSTTIMDTDELTASPHSQLDYFSKNFPEGLIAPTGCDLGVIDAHRTDYQHACGIQEDSPMPIQPTCSGGTVTGFSDNGVPSLTCGGPACNGCNPNCSNFAPQNCSGGGSGGNSPPPNECSQRPTGFSCGDGTSVECDPTYGWYCSNECIGPEPEACCNDCYEECEDGQWTCIGSPVLIDVFGKGFQLTDIAHGVQFEVMPNQGTHQMSWPQAATRDGWLALDRNGDGMITNFTELFGNATPQPPGSDLNGYRALAVFDDPQNGGNGNGVIDPEDSIYDYLRIWIDDNHDGISQSTELYTLRDAGIFSIDLHYFSSPYVDSNGNQFRYKSFVLDKAGIEHDICYDVFVKVAN